MTENHSEEKQDKKLVDDDKSIQYWIYAVIALTVIIATISYYVPEVSNNVTLVIEIGIGILITLVVHRFGKISERKNKEFMTTMDEKNEVYLKKVQLLLAEQKFQRQNRRGGVYGNLYFTHIILDDIIGEVKNILEGDTKRAFDKLERSKEEFQKIIDEYHDVISSHERDLLDALIYYCDDMTYVINSSVTNIELKGKESLKKEIVDLTQKAISKNETLENYFKPGSKYS